MRGIILAAGASSRMGPAAALMSKQHLPVFDKPMIYYPLSTLMLAGVRQILIIARPDEVNAFQTLLGDGADLGLSLEYAVQEQPRGIADALLIGQTFLQGATCCLALGDNLLLGSGLGTSLRQLESTEFATILGFAMSDPSPYGVVELDGEGRICSLVEKPAVSKPGIAIPGVYFLPPDAPQMAKDLDPSTRGELEITDLNLRYLAEGRLRIRLLPRSTYWVDVGTPERLLDAGSFVKALSERDGTVISCPEEIAFSCGWIEADSLLRSARRFAGSRYGGHLLNLSKQAGAQG